MPLWDLPTSAAHIFPKHDVDRLENEAGYYPWSLQMKNVFSTAEMWGVVSGTETKPGNDVFNSEAHTNWESKDDMAKALITQCIKSDLIIKVTHAGLIMLWFRQLTKQMPAGSNVTAHCTNFQEAICYLANAEFEILSYIVAAILLSTLPSGPSGPQSWNNHVTGVKIEKTTTTLPSVINGILKEKCRLTDGETPSCRSKKQPSQC